MPKPKRTKSPSKLFGLAIIEPFTGTLEEAVKEAEHRLEEDELIETQILILLADPVTNQFTIIKHVESRLHTVNYK